MWAVPYYMGIHTMWTIIYFSSTAAIRHHPPTALISWTIVWSFIMNATRFYKVRRFWLLTFDREDFMWAFFHQVHKWPWHELMNWMHPFSLVSSSSLDRVNEDHMHNAFLIEPKAVKCRVTQLFLFCSFALRSCTWIFCSFSCGLTFGPTIFPTRLTWRREMTASHVTRLPSFLVRVV